MAGKVFVPTGDVAKIQDAQEGLRNAGAGLHAMMRFEVLNFADGKRNAYEVYEAVAAEALAAGEWYYGRVEPDQVLKVLEKATELGLFTVKSVR